MKPILSGLVVILVLTVQTIVWGFQPEEVIMAKKNGTNGISRVYPVTGDQAWEIALAALRWEKSNRITEYRTKNYLLTSNGISSCPCRTEVGVWIEPQSAEATNVTIVTIGREHKNLFTNVETFPDTIKPDFHKFFAEGVKLVKNGQKLPKTPPKI